MEGSTRCRDESATRYGKKPNSLEVYIPEETTTTREASGKAEIGFSYDDTPAQASGSLDGTSRIPHLLSTLVEPQMMTVIRKTSRSNRHRE